MDDLNLSLSNTYKKLEPPHGFSGFEFHEIWQRRELVCFLAWRDIQARYKHTFIGITWAILQPLLMMLVFGLFLGKLSPQPNSGIPYLISTYTALVPWTFFANGFSQASLSIVNNRSLVTKVAIPKLMLPIAPVLSTVVDMVCAFAVLIGMMVFCQISFLPKCFFSLLFTLLAFFSALGVGVWLAALNVRYRDIRLVIPFFSQILLFASPVVQSMDLFPYSWKLIWALNPMCAVIEGFRWCLLSNSSLSIEVVIISTVSATLIFASGVFYFKKNEKYFADIL